MTQTHTLKAEPVREDEHHIAFNDTRAFASNKWNTTVQAVQAQNLNQVDTQKARHVQNWEKFNAWIQETIAANSENTMLCSKLQSLTLLGPPLANFIATFEELIEPERVDMTILWGLVYLNVKLALASTEKMKRITRYMGTIRKHLDALNHCVKDWQNENSARTEITDMFEPLMQLLTGLIKAQHIYVTDKTFQNALRDIEDLMEPHIDDIQDVVNHFRSMSTYSKANQATEASLQAQRVLAFRENDPNDFTAFPVQNLPNIQTNQFFGRDANITRIGEHLNKTDVAGLKTYLIYGRRGVGKTQIALEYARRYLHVFDAVFWIRCETSASLRQSIADMAAVLHLPGHEKPGHYEENLIKVLQWLKKTTKKWLMIYDNAERGELLNPYWPRGASGSILLTSRSYYNFENDPHRTGETVDVFNPDESWELLMQILGKDWQHEHLSGKQGQLERSAARTLLDKLGGLALAISQAAKLVRENKVTGDTSIHTLLELFEQHRQNLPPRQIGYRDTYTHALDTVWSIAFDALSPNARGLMGAFALLSPDSIPEDLFLPKNQARLDGRLEFCKQTNRATATEMSDGMRDAVLELKMHLPGFRQFDRVFAVHRVIQEALNYKNLNDLRESFDAVTQLLHEAFPKQEKGRPLHDQWPRCQMYVQHVIHLSNLFVQFRKGREEMFAPHLDFVRLLSNCGWYLFEIGDYAECLEMMNVAMAACEDKTRLLYSHLQNTKGAAHYELNQLERSRKAFEKTLEIRMKLLPSEDLQVASVLANIGNIESAEGNLDIAQELFEKAARIREAHGEEELVMLGLTYLQLGRISFLRKEDLFAHKMYNKAEACFVKSTGQDQVFMAVLHYANGNLEFQKKNYVAAIRNYEACRDLCHKVGPVHPQMTATYYKLGCVEQRRGNNDKALMYLEKAFNIADIRSPGAIDGTIARILWKKSEILLDEPLRRAEGLVLKEQLDVELDKIATDLGLQIDPDSKTDKAFDLLVPGYFR